MRSRVQRWGNSLAVRIPRPYASELGLTEDAPVEVAVDDGGLVVRPLAPDELSLEDLLAAVTPENIHEEQDFGRREGNEAW